MEKRWNRAGTVMLAHHLKMEEKMNEKSVTNRRTGWWIVAGLCGLLAAAFVVGQAQAARNITTSNIPKTLFVYSVNGNKYVGKVESVSHRYAYAYHEYYHILFRVERDWIGGGSSLFYTTNNCSGTPYMDVDEEDTDWRQHTFALEYVDGYVLEIFKPYGEATGWTARSYVDQNGYCRDAGGASPIFAKPAKSTGQYIPAPPYKLRVRYTRPPRRAVE